MPVGRAWRHTSAVLDYHYNGAAGRWFRHRAFATPVLPHALRWLRPLWPTRILMPTVGLTPARWPTRLVRCGNIADYNLVGHTACGTRRYAFLVATVR